MCAIHTVVVRIKLSTERTFVEHPSKNDQFILHRRLHSDEQCNCDASSLSTILTRSLTYGFCLVLSVSLGMGEDRLSSRLWACPVSAIPREITAADFGLSARMTDIILEFPLLMSVSCLWRIGFRATAPDRFPSIGRILSCSDLDGDRDWHTDHQFHYQICLYRQLSKSNQRLFTIYIVMTTYELKISIKYNSNYTKLKFSSKAQARTKFQT